MIYFFIIILLFTQGSLFSTYCTVINEDPAIEVRIIFKAPIWATDSLHSIRQPRKNHRPWGSHAGSNSHRSEIQALSSYIADARQYIHLMKTYGT